MTREEVFSKRPSTEAYLSHIYSYLPREFEYLDEGSAVPRSDEALFSWYQWVDYLVFNTVLGDLLLALLIFGRGSTKVLTKLPFS